MQTIHEVTVYTNGPAREYATWSNVPLSFTQALERGGLRLHLVDLNPPPLVERAYNLFVRQAWKLFHPDSTYNYFRSAGHAGAVEGRIRRADRQFPHSQADIFLTYSFSSPLPRRRPAVLICDWPYRYLLEHFRGRPPDRMEAAAARYEDRQIESADLVVSLFPGVAEAMRSIYRNPNIFHIGPAVNLSAPPVEASLLERKQASRALLFIGDDKYLPGARTLLAAFAGLRRADPALHLDIVGLRENQMGPLPPGVTCHGYLDKGRPEQLARYLQLLGDARMVVNTNPRWGPFSSFLEALHHFTPLVIAPYDEFVRTFGKEIAFGLYCPENDPQALARSISSLLADAEYPARARAAHAAVREFTWERFADRLLGLIEARV